MSAGSPPLPRGRADRFLLGSLFVLGALPALAFSFGLEDGSVLFVLYREPKLVAVQVLGWIFLVGFFWAHRESLLGSDPGEVLRRLPFPFWLLAAFAGYGGLTATWALVYENSFYELSQYTLLIPLTLGLFWWSQRDGRVGPRVESALVGSLGAATLVGLFQGFVPIPFLSPITPEMGVSNPSFMGYKNPMALSLLGQLYLVLARVVSPGATPRRRVAWSVLFVLELWYLISLRSRTSYQALAVSAAFWIGLSLFRAPTRRARARALLATAGIVAVAAAAVTASPPLRERAASALGYVLRPATFLSSDRGAYLLNSLHMARLRPLGVGLGDWQTHYPVYRLHQRDRSFSDEFQVRRAHGDHAQIVGELGWPGTALWLAFLGSLLVAATRAGLARGDPASLCPAAQIVAIGSAMATDHLLELPYNKFQLFLIVFLVMAAVSPPRAEPARPHPYPRWLFPILAVLLSGAAVTSVYYFAGHARRVHVSARMTSEYLAAVEGEEGNARRAIDASRLARVLEHGERLDSLPGYAKTDHKDYLALSQAAFLLGRPGRALAYARRSLELHPYYPNTLRWMAVLFRSESPEIAEQWRRAYEYVVNEAESGFRIPYPEGAPSPSPRP